MKVMKLLIWYVLLAGASAVSAPSSNGLYATLQTTMGEVCFELYYTNAPRTVANFVSLAEGSRPWIDPRTTFVSTDPYYNGGIFHRVISNFMIQCGSPKGNGTDGPGYTFEDEFSPALRHDRPGTVSMANSGFDSNGGQFFITTAATAWLDDKHSVFGRVAEGMNVVSNIAAVATANEKPLIDVVITNVFITRNGTNAQNFAVTNQLLPEVTSLPISITNTNGIRIATGTATSGYQYIYSSTNLYDWSEAASKYWPEASGDWSFAISGELKEFFHATRVEYVPDVNMPDTIAGHHLTITLPGSSPLVLQVNPVSGGGGVFSYAGYPDDGLVSWSWDKEPYRSVFFVRTDYPEYYTFLLHYSSPTSGRCQVYYYYSGWQNWGEGTFTDQNLN